MSDDFWPGPDEVASVIVAACREVGGDPLQIDSPANCSRGRGVAFIALARVRPQLDRHRLGKMLGASGPAWVKNWLVNGMRTRSRWFDYAIVDRVVERVYGRKDVVINVEKAESEPHGPPKTESVRMVEGGALDDVDRVEAPPQAAVTLEPEAPEHRLMTVSEEIANHPINTLTTTNCRWPIATNGDLVTCYCCEPQCGEAEPYCARHVRMARGK